MKAWQLIEKPENWTNGYPSWSPRTNPNGTHCLVTSIELAYINDAQELRKAYQRLYPKIPGNCLVEFNESHTHAEVLAVLKELDI